MKNAIDLNIGAAALVAFVVVVVEYFLFLYDLVN